MVFRCIKYRKINKIEHDNKIINNVILYYFKGKINKINNNISTEYEKQIDYICNKDYHIMPFLLTPLESKCNILGLYTKYISTGAFICKLFDYSTDKYMQCTEEENNLGKCSRFYSYIGTRYLNIFPFNKL